MYISKSIHTLGQWTCLSAIPNLGQEVTTKSLYQIIPIEGALQVGAWLRKVVAPGDHHSAGSQQVVQIGSTVVFVGETIVAWLICKM